MSQAFAKKPYRRMRGNGQGSAYKRGRTWTAVYIYAWIEGKPQKRTKGGFRTKKEALEFIPVLKLKKSRPDADPPLKNIYADWCPYYAPRISKNTMKGLKSAWKWCIDVQNENIGDLTIDDLQECVDACPRGKRTKENIKYLLTQLYDYAAARKILDQNIARYIYCGKGADGVREPFSSEEIEKIREAIGKIFGADYIICMIYTGFRPNEMLKLTASSYDNKHDCLVGGFKTEAGKDRKITISPKIKPIIEELLKKANPWIFPDKNGKRLTDETFRKKIFYPILAELDIQPIPQKGERARIVPYSCRHTFANLMKNVAGADTDKAALMGHSDASGPKGRRFKSCHLDHLHDNF